MATEFQYFKDEFAAERKRTTYSAHDTEHLTAKARFACNLVERWGMVAARDDGEDSAGRHKIKLHSPTEVVSRAVEMTDALWVALRKEGWIEDIPTLEEIKKNLTEKETEEVY